MSKWTVRHGERRRQRARAAFATEPGSGRKLGVPYQMSSTVKELRRIDASPGPTSAVIGGGTNSKRSTAAPGHRVTRLVDVARPPLHRDGRYPSGTRSSAEDPRAPRRGRREGRPDRHEASVDRGRRQAVRPRRPERVEIDGRTRELPGPGGGDDLVGNGEAAGATTIEGEPIDLSCRVPHRRQRRTAP